MASGNQWRRVLLSAGLVIGLASFPSFSQAANNAVMDVDRTARVVTEEGDLLVRHRAVTEGDAVFHEYTIRNLSFGEPEFGLTSVDLPIPPGAHIVEGSLTLPEGWEFSDPLPDDVKAPFAHEDALPPYGRWKSLQPGGWRYIEFIAQDLGAPRRARSSIGIGQVATFSYRVPQLPQGAVPYSQEISRYGTVTAVELPPHSGRRPKIEWVDHTTPDIIAVEDEEDDEDTDTSIEPDPNPDPVAMANPDSPETYGDDAPAAATLPDYRISFDSSGTACGSIGTSETYMTVRVLVENAGGSSSSDSTVRLETSLGSYDFTIGGLQAGDVQPVEFTVRAPGAASASRRVALLAIADADDDIRELSESNNTATTMTARGDLDVAPRPQSGMLAYLAQPDLAMLIGTSHAVCNYYPDTETCVFSALVYYRNEGAGWALGDVVIRFEGAFGTDEVNVGSLAPGARSMTEFHFEFSDPWPCDYSGSTSISFTIALDPGNQIVESDEGDNVGSVNYFCTDCYFCGDGGDLEKPSDEPPDKDGQQTPTDPP